MFFKPSFIYSNTVSAKRWRGRVWHEVKDWLLLSKHMFMIMLYAFTVAAFIFSIFVLCWALPNYK